MDLQTIYKPISQELSQVETEIKRQIYGIHEKEELVKKTLIYFFEMMGKHLRPALVLLSAKSGNGHGNFPKKDLVLLSVAIEMIHSASLIHDDIVDDEENRRGILSMNKKFGNKVAMLVGDILYSKAFLILVNNFDKSMIRLITECAEKMCFGEVNELENPVNSTEKYLDIIKRKTASFMSTCCEVGAMVTSKDRNFIEVVKEYGLNYGIIFQIMDDYKDNDVFKGSKDVLKDKKLLGLANKYAIDAKNLAKKISGSPISRNFCDLVDYTLCGVN